MAELFLADSMLNRLFQAIAPLYLMEFLINLSLGSGGGGGAISPFDADNNGKAKPT